MDASAPLMTFSDINADSHIFDSIVNIGHEIQEYSQVANNPKAYANLILLGHRFGWVSSLQIVEIAILNNPYNTIFRLACDTFKAIADLIDQSANTVFRSEHRRSCFEMIFYDDSSENDSVIALTNETIFPVNAPFSDLPIEFRHAIFVAIEVINAPYLFVATPDYQLNSFYWFAEKVMAFSNAVNDVGNDTRKVMRHVLETQGYAFDELFYDLEFDLPTDLSNLDLDDFLIICFQDKNVIEYFEHWIQYTKSSWLEDSKLDTIPKDQWLLKEVWSWRKTHPEWYQSEWGRFVKRAALVSQRREKRTRNNKTPLLPIAEPYENEIDVSLSIPIMVGYGWEMELYELIYNDVMNIGEQFVTKILLTDSPDYCAKESFVAIGESMGLLNFLFEKLDTDSLEKK